MSEVRIISATYPIFDPYTKTPEELIKDRYTDLSMVQATVEIRTNYAVGSEIFRSSNELIFHVIPSKSKIIEYEYNTLSEPQEITDESIAKDEEYFMLQMELWQESLRTHNRAIELGVNPDFAKYMLPATMLALTFDMCGNIPQWKKWIDNNKDNLELSEIVIMIRKSLNKYFPNHIEYRE